MAVYKSALSRKLSHDLYDYQLPLLSSRITGLQYLYIVRPNACY
ncbi:hypothetical protein [Streptococcus pantholopis]